MLILRFLHKHSLLFCFIIILFSFLMLLRLTDQNNLFLLNLLTIISAFLFLGLLYLVQTVKKLQTQLKQFKRLAYTDTLTGIPNRRLFRKHFNKTYHEAILMQKPISIAIIDIDRFKAFNDTFGHQAGDDCLRDVAHAIVNEFKQSNHFIARYGGEEFIMILSNTDKQEAIQIAEKIRQKIEHHPITHINNDAYEITISIGIASMLPSKEYEKDLLIELADRSLYEAKRRGRNKVVGELGHVMSQ